MSLWKEEKKNKGDSEKREKKEIEWIPINLGKPIKCKIYLKKNDIIAFSVILLQSTCFFVNKIIISLQTSYIIN